MMLSELLELMEKVKKEEREKDGMPNIAEISARLEHTKYHLINKLNELKDGKSYFLFIRNIILIHEFNTYSCFNRFFKKQKPEEILKILKEVNDDYINIFKSLFEDLEEAKKDN